MSVTDTGVGMTAEVLERAHRNADGTFRAAAARLLKGKILGGFRYEGTRPDDPNDIVPHEHRRELRALRVFGAWTNLTDMKAGNTLDVLEPVNGRGIVKHYLQDVGSTFGIGANGHIGFNEPTSSFGSRTRLKTLALRTRADNARFFGDPDEVPTHCVTQGLGTIMEARALLLVAQGEKKAAAVAASSRQ